MGRKDTPMAIEQRKILKSTVKQAKIENEIPKYDNPTLEDAIKFYKGVIELYKS